MRPESLLLLGRGENSIFQIQQELRERDVSVIPVVADVRDTTRMEQIFQRFRPTVVFHAAAHKHVPMMEAHPEEAVTNNMLGTRNVVRLAGRYDVKRFVLISSDKAVNPTSVMGASKRVAELIVQAAAQSGVQEQLTGIDRMNRMESGQCSSSHPVHPVYPCSMPELLNAPRFMAVRFGNVLGSRGSVVPTMLGQIRKGGPVTVTHPEMVRYFMTIPEAVLLLLQAGALGAGGEIFMLDMGDPVRIVDLARDLIRLSGLVPEKDVAIQFTGLRPGEKLYEELLTQSEGAAVTRHEKIFAAGPMPVDAAALDASLDALAALAATGDADGIRVLLRQVVPTYHEPAPVPLPAPQPAVRPAAAAPAPEPAAMESRTRVIPGGAAAGSLP
jgi:FlaA1/EpsC-like NDP-sugar epimerase